MDAKYKLSVNITREPGHDYNGMSLYILKGVQADAKGEPIVWFKYDDWQEGSNELTWTENYKAYISTNTDNLKSGLKISCKAQEDIRLGETLSYNDIHGAKSKTVADPPNEVIGVRNNTDAVKTCGLMQPNNQGVDSAICAFLLEGHFTVQMKPYIKLVLFWATTSKTDTGTVVERAFGDGIEVNFGDDKSKVVSFSTKGVWTPDVFTTPVKTEAFLGPLLVKPL